MCFALQTVQGHSWTVTVIKRGEHTSNVMVARWLSELLQKLRMALLTAVQLWRVSAKRPQEGHWMHEEHAVQLVNNVLASLGSRLQKAHAMLLLNYALFSSGCYS